MKQNRMIKMGDEGFLFGGGLENACRRQVFAGQRAGGWPERIAPCIAFMEQNVNRPLQVGALAAQASLSASHFYALFKRQTGCSPIDYFTRLRMLRACELFDATAASVKEVAAMMGYKDPFYFSRVFKLVSAMPPTCYRHLELARRGAVRDKIQQELNKSFLPGDTLRREAHLALS